MLIKNERVCFDIIDQKLVVMIGSSKPVTLEEMRQTHQETLRFDTSKMRCIVISDGAPMSKESRQEASKSETRNIPTAVVTDGAAIRFFIAAFSLINKNIKAVSGSNLREALSWLKVTPEEKAKLYAISAEAAEFKEFVMAKSVALALKADLDKARF